MRKRRASDQTRRRLAEQERGRHRDREAESKLGRERLGPAVGGARRQPGDGHEPPRQARHRAPAPSAKAAQPEIDRQEQGRPRRGQQQRQTERKQNDEGAEARGTFVHGFGRDGAGVVHGYGYDATGDYSVARSVLHTRRAGRPRAEGLSPVTSRGAPSGVDLRRESPALDSGGLRALRPPLRSLPSPLDSSPRIAKVAALDQNTAQACSSVGEHYLDTVGVGGSIPPMPTTLPVPR